MIIINLTGGLGNQMFQYAFGRFLSTKYKTELKYHFVNALLSTKRKFELDHFNIKATEVNKKDLNVWKISDNRLINRAFYLLDERFGIQMNNYVKTQKFPYLFDDKLKNIPDNSYIQGFFADIRYFSEIKDIILNDFTLKRTLDYHNQQIVGKMQTSNSVSVHIRRGDYLSLNNNESAFIGLHYYESSISTIKQRVQSPIFYFFSDDIRWCQNEFSSLKNSVFVSHNTGDDSYKDLILMSNCKHNIIANSTFSKWAYILNRNKQKIIIEPLSQNEEI